MSKNGIIIVSTVLLSAVIILIMWLNSLEDSKIAVNLRQERKFNRSLQLIRSNKLDRGYDLMKYSNGNLLFVKWGDGVIYECNENGELVETLGNKGEGPKENMLIGNFGLENNYYYTVDDEKSTIQHVSYSDSLLFYYKYPKPIRRSIKSGESYLIVDWDSEYNMSFDKFDVTTQKIERIKTNIPEISNSELSGLVYDGNFIGNENYMAYVSYSNDYVFCFNNDFEYLYSMEMVYDLPDPKWERLSNGNLYKEPGLPTPTLSYWVDNNDNLYILSINTSESEKNIAIADVYDLKEHKYSYSFKIEKNNDFFPLSIVVNKNMVYVHYPTELSVFDLKSNVKNL